MTSPSVFRRVAAVAWPYVLVAAVGALVLLPRLGEFGLWDPWEPRYPQSVREMEERDNMIVPYFRGEIRMAKPILTYWAVWAGGKVFGEDELGARLPGVLLTILSMLGVYYAVEKMRGRAPALISAIVLGTLPQYYLLARQATPDIYLAACLGSGLVFFALGFLGPDRRRDVHYGISYVWFSLAVLAKGPVIVGVIWFVSLAIYVVIGLDWNRLLREGGGATWREVVRPALRPVGRQLALAGIVFTVVAGPWHVGIVLEEGSTFFTEFILKHNIQRAGEEINRSGHSDFYFRSLIFGFFPWAGFIPLVLAGVVGWWEDRPLKKYGFEIFLLITCAVTFAAFSSSVTKFQHYISALLVPMACLIGLLLYRLVQNAQTPAARLAWILAAMLYLPPMLDLGREGGLENLLVTFTVKSSLPDAIQLDLFAKSVLAVAFALLLASALFASRVLLAGLLSCAVLFSAWVNIDLIPSVSPYKTMKHLVHSWKEEREDQAPLCLHGKIKFSTIYYTDRKVFVLDDRAVFERFMSPEAPAYCIIMKKKLIALDTAFRQANPGHRLHIIDDSHLRFVLVSNRRGRFGGNPLTGTEP